MTALTSLFPAAPSDADLERFVGAALHAAGEWPSPRTSDGILDWELLEHNAAALRAWGLVYSIDQALHPFWLELEQGADDLRWTLRLDVDAREVRNAYDAADRPQDLRWLAVFHGRVASAGDPVVEGTDA